MIRANALIFPLAFAAVCAGSSAPACAQQQSDAPVSSKGLFTLRGSTFDSLTGRPLARAIVRMSGRLEAQVSDSEGLFRFDSVAAGDYLLVMEHPRLDSLGLPEVGTRTTVSREHQDVTVSVPSFATLWRGICGSSKAPKDSGFIYGAILDAETRAGVGNARVFVSWYDVGLNRRQLQQTRFTIETSSDSGGTYIACGLPTGEPLEISAIQTLAGASHPDTALIATFMLPARTTRIQRRDLLVATSAAGRAAMKGSVRGRVLNESGEPFADVRVSIDGRESTRSDASGNYVLTDINVGTHTITFASLGRESVTRIVELLPSSTLLVGARLDRLSTTLIQEGMRGDVATLILRNFEKRNAKRGRQPYNILDSVQIMQKGTMEKIVAGMFKEKGGPLVTTNSRDIRDRCEMNIYIDNNLQSHQMFWKIAPHELAWIEFINDSKDPEFSGPTECTSIVLFTKRAIGR